MSGVEKLNLVVQGNDPIVKLTIFEVTVLFVKGIIVTAIYLS